ncbi:MAG: AAA family ATPase, partial [Pseudomonadota bacterium]
MTAFDDRTTTALERIADALERMAPAPGAVPDWSIANAWMWGTEPDRLTPIPKVNRVEMDLLVGIDRARD